MENFTENRKRGRPPKYPPQFTSVVKNLYPEESARTVANKVYGVKAASRFSDDPRFSWIFEVDKATNKYKREGLMQELGRFAEEHPTGAEEAALWLIERKPKVRDGVAMLRRWRRKLSGKEIDLGGNAEQLTGELIDTINRYLGRYPKVSQASILEALSSCREIVEED